MKYWLSSATQPSTTIIVTIYCRLKEIGNEEFPLSWQFGNNKIFQRKQRWLRQENCTAMQWHEYDAYVQNDFQEHWRNFCHVKSKPFRRTRSHCSKCAPINSMLLVTIDSKRASIVVRLCFFASIHLPSVILCIVCSWKRSTAQWPGFPHSGRDKTDTISQTTF